MPITADIHYHIFEGSAEGERPALILIHGAGGDYLYWPPNIRRIKGYRIYAPDLPGHGKSGGRGHQNLSDYAGKLIDWMDKIGLHSAFIAGHSMGAGIALDIALNHPTRVSGLALVGGGSRLRVNPDLLEAASSPTTYHNAIEDIVAWSFAPDTPDAVKELAAKRMQEIRPSVLHGDLIACADFNVTDRLGEIYRPTLIICGEDDKMTPVRYSQQLADNIHNSTLKIIPTAGHMVMLEQPSLVEDYLIEFLDEIPR